MQRGYGLGGLFSSLFRRAIPLFKSGGKYLAKKAVKTGLNTIHDISSGAQPRTAVKRRLADISDEMLDDVKRKIRRKMTGGGGLRKKRKTKKKKKRVNKKKKRGKGGKRKIKDIFKI